MCVFFSFPFPFLFQADVFVNSAPSNLNLSNGGVSQVILQAAGPALQQECKTLVSSRGKIPPNSFVETGPGNLQCKKVYHCVCGGYNAGVSEDVSLCFPSSTHLVSFTRNRPELPKILQKPCPKWMSRARARSLLHWKHMEMRLQ